MSRDEGSLRECRLRDEMSLQFGGQKFCERTGALEGAGMPEGDQELSDRRCSGTEWGLRDGMGFQEGWGLCGGLELSQGVQELCGDSGELGALSRERTRPPQGDGDSKKRQALCGRWGSGQGLGCRAGFVSIKAQKREHGLSEGMGANLQGTEAPEGAWGFPRG